MQSDLSEMKSSAVPLSVRTARVGRAKIEITLAVMGDLEKYRPAIVDSFVQLGAEYRCSRAPPATMEREFRNLSCSWSVRRP